MLKRKSLFTCFSVYIFLSCSLFAKPPLKLQPLHKKINDQLQFKFPPTAPDTFENVAALNWPDGLKLFALDFSGISDPKGTFIGPDGGKVHLYAKNYWYWHRKDEIKFSASPDGGWSMQYKNHNIQKYGGKSHGVSLWTFPDKSKIRKIETGYDNISFFYQKYNRSTIIAFRLFQQVPNRVKKKPVGIYDFYFDEKIEKYIKYLGRINQLNDYFSYVKKIFQFENQGRISVYYADDFNNYRKIIQNKTAGAGAVTDMFGIYICCTTNSVLENKNANDNLYIMPLGVLLHETTHNLQQHRCQSIRNGKKMPGKKDPGSWFIEGQANYIVLKILPEHSNYLKNKIIVALDKAKGKSIKKLGYNESAYIGTLMVQYIAQQWGTDALKTYFENTCMGKSPETALEGLTKKTITQIYNDTISSFENQ